MSIREMVSQIQIEIRDTDLSPERASVLLTKLTALLGNVLAEIREADAEYAVVRVMHYEKTGKANHADMLAETSPEYRRKREARDTKELVHELIGGLKYMLRSLEAEMRLAR